MDVGSEPATVIRRGNAVRAVLCMKHTFLEEQSLWEFGHWTLLGLEADPSLQGGVRCFCQGIAELREEINQQQLSCNQYLPLLESLAPP